MRDGKNKEPAGLLRLFFIPFYLILFIKACEYNFSCSICSIAYWLVCSRWKEIGTPIKLLFSWNPFYPGKLWRGRERERERPLGINWIENNGNIKQRPRSEGTAASSLKLDLPGNFPCSRFLEGWGSRRE